MSDQLLVIWSSEQWLNDRHTGRGERSESLNFVSRELNSLNPFNVFLKEIYLEVLPRALVHYFEA